MKKEIQAGINRQNIQRLHLKDNYALEVLKCFVDTDCDKSSSAGWQFVKYCMRG